MGNRLLYAAFEDVARAAVEAAAAFQAQVAPIDAVDTGRARPLDEVGRGAFAGPLRPR